MDVSKKCEKIFFRKYICETIEELEYHEIVKIYHFIVANIDRDEIKTHGNGCSVNLDNMDDDVIELVYNLVWKKRNEW